MHKESHKHWKHSQLSQFAWPTMPPWEPPWMIWCSMNVDRAQSCTMAGSSAEAAEGRTGMTWESQWYYIYIYCRYIYYMELYLYYIYIYIHTPTCLLKAPRNDETLNQRMFQLVWVTIEGNCNMWIIFPWPLSRIHRGSNGFSNGFTEVARLACCAAWSLMGRRKQRLSWSFTSAWSSVVTQWGSNGVQWVDWFNMI